MSEVIGPEALLVSLALLVAVVYPKLGVRWFVRAERFFGSIAAHRRTSVLSMRSRCAGYPGASARDCTDTGAVCAR